MKGSLLNGCSTCVIRYLGLCSVCCQCLCGSEGGVGHERRSALRVINICD